jgi:hypothetical protein
MHRIVLIITFFIYVITGRVIFIHRRNLRRFGSDTVDVSDAEGGTVRNSDGVASDTVHSSTINALGEAKVAAPRRPAARRRTNAAMEANIAAWAYCRCAMLFFLALVITWVCFLFIPPFSLLLAYILLPGRGRYGQHILTGDVKVAFEHQSSLPTAAFRGLQVVLGRCFGAARAGVLEWSHLYYHDVAGV